MENHARPGWQDPDHPFHPAVTRGGIQEAEEISKMTRSVRLTLIVIPFGWAVLNLLRAQPPAAAPSTIQRQPQVEVPPPVIHVGTQLVEVEVVVRDKDGPVTGLTRDDFTLLDQGKKQKIAVFGGGTPGAESPSGSVKSPNRGLSANQTDSPGHPAAGATALLIDLLNTSLDDQGYTRSEVLKYLESADTGGHVAIYMLGKGLSVIQDFSDNGAAVAQAVRKWDPKDLSVLIQNTENMDAVDRGMQCGILCQEIRNQTTSQALDRITQDMSSMPGRKSLIWISDTPGAAGAQFLGRANIHLYPVLARGVGTSGVVGMLRDQGELGRAGISAPQAMASGTEIERRHANDALAAANGGAGFTDSHDIPLAIKTAIEDTDSAYFLGFYPDEDRLDNKFHGLTVTLGKNRVARGRTIEIRYRPGYFASAAQPPTAPQTGVPANAPRSATDRSLPARGAAASLEPTKLTLDELLKDPLDLSRVDVTAEPVPDPAQPGSFLIKVKIDPRDLGLQYENSTRSGLVNVSFYVRESGKLVTRMLKVAIPDDEYDAFLENGIETVESIDMAGATGNLRVVVQDQASGAAGSVTVPIGRK
jgi:VWFA-related protein